MLKEHHFEDGLTMQDMAALRIESTPSPASSSSLSRLSSPSVRITEFSDMYLNPRPVIEEEMTEEESREEFVSPSKLRMASGVEDLSRVTYLEMRVNTAEQMLGNFGSILTNLVQLKLNNSHILSIRDIGTSLNNLRVLWMARCGLRDVDGASALESLEELYLAFNELSDISPLSLLERLEILDLEGNNIGDEEQTSYLSLCPSLRSLTLEGNPVCLKLAESKTDCTGYRESVKRAIPGLLLLDDEPVVTGSIPSDLQTRSSIFESLRTGTDKEWTLVKEGVKRRSSDIVDSKQNGDGELSRRPSSHTLTPRSHVMDRPATSLGNYSLNSPPGRSGDLYSLNNSSELTHGLNQVMCGNPVRALRERKRHGLGAQSTITLTPVSEAVTGEYDIIEELKLWRQQYSRMSQSLSQETSTDGRTDVVVDGRTDSRTDRTTDPNTDKISETRDPDDNMDDLFITKTSSVTDLDEEGVRDQAVLEDSVEMKTGSIPRMPHPPDTLPHPPSGRKRVLPSPPAGKPSHPPRPHTAADFRARRLRRHSSENASLFDTSVRGGASKQTELDARTMPPQTTSTLSKHVSDRNSRQVEPVLIASTETKSTIRKLPRARTFKTPTTDPSHT